MESINIIRDYLIENGYGGLCNSEADWCACDVDDLNCCGENFAECEPCYKIKAQCDICEVREHCECPDEAEFCYTKNPNRKFRKRENAKQQPHAKIDKA